jgi:hypothetical protein
MTCHNFLSALAAKAWTRVCIDRACLPNGFLTVLRMTSGCAGAQEDDSEHRVGRVELDCSDLACSPNIVGWHHIRQQGESVGLLKLSVHPAECSHSSNSSEGGVSDAQGHE